LPCSHTSDESVCGSILGDNVSSRRGKEMLSVASLFRRLMFGFMLTVTRFLSGDLLVGCIGLGEKECYVSGENNKLVDVIEFDPFVTFTSFVQDKRPRMQSFKPIHLICVY
jgi:hypothetical protein